MAGIKKNEKSGMKGFPGPGQRNYGSVGFVLKFIALILFSIVDIVWSIIKYEAAFISGIMRRRSLLDMLARYREYNLRLTEQARKNGVRILHKVSMQTVYTRVTDYRKNHFGGREAELVFGEEGAVHNFRDFQKQYNQYKKHQERKHRRLRDESGVKDPKEQSPELEQRGRRDAS